MSVKKIAIVGAAGFVGLELVSQLENIEGYDLYAVTRDNGNFLLNEKKIKLLAEAEIEKYKPFDTVINLAYPTVPNASMYPDVNKKILGTLKKLCDSNTRLVHVSTQAVFGFGMEHEVVTNFIPLRRDFAYIEAKLEMEHAIKKHFSKNNTAIVRLGNVWGAASAVWTASIAERLVFGQYTGVEGVDGFSNITDVKNVASYLVFLTQKTELNGLNIYHLAEFSNIKWSQIIQLFAEKLKVPPVFSDTAPSPAIPFRKEVAGLFKAAITQSWGKINLLRISSSYLRSAIRLYGVAKYDNLKKGRLRPLPKMDSLDGADDIFLTVLTSKAEFKTVVDQSWVPLVNFEQSWKIVEIWMKESGYIY